MYFGIEDAATVLYTMPIFLQTTGPLAERNSQAAFYRCSGRSPEIPDSDAQPWDIYYGDTGVPLMRLYGFTGIYERDGASPKRHMHVRWIRSIVASMSEIAVCMTYE